MARGSRWLLLALGVACAAAPGAAAPCGLEDAASLSALRGFLNAAYPDSLHVGTAIWRAQRAGTLPRDDLAPRLQLIQANALMRALAAQLDTARDAPGRPALSIVMVGPMLWSRLEPQAESILATVHVDGPRPGDVVIVTDAPALRALVNGEMTLAKALDAGLVRLYGERQRVDAARTWLAGAGRT